MNKNIKSLSIAALLSVISVSVVSAQATTSISMPETKMNMATSTSIKKYTDKKMIETKEKGTKKENKISKPHKGMKKIHTATTTTAHN